MKKTKEIIKDIFIFILPLFILIDSMCQLVTWNADYFYQGVTYSANSLSGFPFIDNGIFAGMNSMATSGNTTTNMTNFALNKSIEIMITLFIYLFVLNKISFESKSRTIILTIIVTFIYLKFSLLLFFFYSNMIENQYGTWPDNLEIKNIGWQTIRWFKYIF